MTDELKDRLVALSELGSFRVAKGESDIRGWEVVASDKKKIGKVHELIVDTVDLKVRYLDIDVDNRILETKSNSHILVPIAGAQLDDDDNRVYLNEISVSELTAIPPYDHRRITREFEANVASWFRTASASDSAAKSPGEPTGAADDSAFYEQQQFSDRGFWGKRRAGREKESYLAAGSDPGRDELVAPPPGDRPADDSQR